MCLGRSAGSTKKLEQEIGGTILGAYDFANRDEGAVAAREGRMPARPRYAWSAESLAAKRKSRDA
jgi:hypothetical protein